MKNVLKYVGLGLMIALVLVALFLFFRFRSLGKQSQSMNVEMALVDGALAPCGEKPNCVSSTDTREEFRVLPIAYTIETKEIRARLDEVIRKLGGKLQSAELNYYHYTFESKLFGFVDDLQIQVEPETIHIRSESRVGYSDMGANRKRVEKILSKLDTTTEP